MNSEFVLVCKAIHTVTLLNINENKRFEEGAVQFLGCLPIYDYDASLLGSDGKKQNRAAAIEMFHDYMTIISADIAEFCNDQHTMMWR